ncbi:MAG TPA: type II secretion system protein GspM [Burkholderiales bacterium]|jgi:MSHA biogenesis protein MshJ|nr:type II secretion system protein GspM [Burkholderiales bacterium]
MSAAWNRLNERFSKFNDRERLAVLVAGIVVIAGLGFALFVDGNLARQKVARESLARQHAELSQLQAQNAELTRSLAQDPDAASRQRIEQLRVELGGYEAELRGVQQGLVAPERMVRLLEGMLAGQTRVRLVSLKTLPVSSLIESAPAEGAADARVKEDKRLVYKHGIELTVEGSYPELVEYQARLENLPWRMFWAQSRLDATDYPRVRLTLTLYTLSLEKAWLVV